MIAKIPTTPQQQQRPETPTLRPRAIKLQQKTETIEQQRPADVQEQEQERQQTSSGEQMNTRMNELLKMLKKSKAYIIALALTQVAQLVGTGF